MFEKSILKKQIKRAKKNIEALEKKRIRSQAALVTAILSQQTPKDEDVEYFNRFTELIEAERNKMHRHMQELDNLKK
ncbi:MAG: hypothetical protein IKZ59_00315 [Clostridia bacterium]|nr:hypothetical protein [Clostridia bacterium]